VEAAPQARVPAFPGRRTDIAIRLDTSLQLTRRVFELLFYILFLLTVAGRASRQSAT
jgi:hypothetical protein